MFHSFLKWFWNYEFWLPHGFTWEDISNMEPNPPKLSDLYIVPVLTVFILLTRYLFERYIATKFCAMIGIRNPVNTSEAHTICEQVFGYVTTNPDQSKVNELSTQTGWTSKKVTHWFRKRRNQKHKNNMDRATETLWRCLFYFGLFCYGCYVLLPTDWFWETDKWLLGYIKDQRMSIRMKWYYYMELGLYLAFLVSQFTDIKRKDFIQMFIHHVITIILIIGSYAIAHFRYGSVIMFVHDASDYWLEAAKLTNYAKLQRVCDVLFFIFAVTFYLSRWIYFPFWVLRSFIIANAKLGGQLRSYFTFPYIFLYMCFVLQLLHLYWGFLIGQMVYRFTVVGKVDKDARSDNSDNDGSD